MIFHKQYIPSEKKKFKNLTFIQSSCPDIRPKAARIIPAKQKKTDQEPNRTKEDPIQIKRERRKKVIIAFFRRCQATLSLYGTLIEPYT